MNKKLFYILVILLVFFSGTMRFLLEMKTTLRRVAFP